MYNTAYTDISTFDIIIVSKKKKIHTSNENMVKMYKIYKQN